MSEPASSTMEETPQIDTEQPSELNIEITEEALDQEKEDKLKKRKEKWDNKREKFRQHKKHKREVKQEKKKKESDEYFTKLREELSKEEFDKLMQENRQQKGSRVESQRKIKEETKNRLTKVVENGIQNDCNVCVNIDCSFNDKMTDNEIISLAQQLGKCYAAYRKMDNPFYMTFTSLQGNLLDSLKRFEGFPDKWIMKMTEDHFTKEFEQKCQENKVIYLSADAEEEITEFQNGYIYIVGGIIDRNRHKNLCNQLAKDELKIPTMKFPLHKHVEMKATSVLTTNQCVEIISEVVERKSSGLSNDEIWGQALQKVIPRRKIKT